MAVSNFESKLSSENNATIFCTKLTHTHTHTKCTHTYSIAYIEKVRNKVKNEMNEWLNMNKTYHAHMPLIGILSYANVYSTCLQKINF